MDEDLVETWQYVSGHLTPEQLCRFAVSLDRFCETMYYDYKENMDEFGRKKITA